MHFLVAFWLYLCILEFRKLAIYIYDAENNNFRNYIYINMSYFGISVSKIFN